MGGDLCVDGQILEQLVVLRLQLLVRMLGNHVVCDMRLLQPLAVLSVFGRV